jgi:hypothetical protein
MGTFQNSLDWNNLWYFSFSKPSIMNKVSWCYFTLNASICLYYIVCIANIVLYLSLPNNVWRLIVFAPFLIIILFLSFFPWTMNLSTADLRNYWTEYHETWWSYRYMFLVGPKVFDDIGQCWIFTAIFLCCVLAAILKIVDISKILKTQNCSFNGDLSLCQILCLYHYLFRSYQH